jgi:hypothetical protein
MTKDTNGFERRQAVLATKNWSGRGEAKPVIYADNAVPGATRFIRSSGRGASGQSRPTGSSAATGATRLRRAVYAKTTTAERWRRMARLFHTL